MADQRCDHQVFIQGFMWKRICSYKVVCKLYSASTGIDEKQIAPADLQIFVNKINKEIEPIHFRIAKGIDEVTGESFYALINTVQNDISLMSVHYSKDELEFMKKIIACIVDSDDGKVSSIVVLNLSDEMEKKMSHKDANNIINKFCQDQWLLEESGFITLTTRTILELKPYLTAVYKDIIAVCQLCNEIVLQGVFCEDCGLKLHNHCRQKLLKRTSQCPGCSVRASNPFGEGTSAG